MNHTERAQQIVRDRKKQSQTQPDTVSAIEMVPVEATPWQPFPVEALPDAVGRFVATAAKAIGCDPSYVALPLLAALAAAIGNTRRIRLKHGWTEPAVIWSAIVGESGTLKSPAADACLRPVRDRQARALKQYEAAMIEYKAAVEEHKAALADWKKNGRDAGVDPPQAPPPPICDRCLVSDTTVEALAERLSKAPRGLLLHRDELAGFLNSFNQYKAGKGGDVAHWLTMHGARDLLVDRKTGDKTTIFVPRAAVSITGGIQPDTLRRTLAREHFEDGLAARLLLAMPPRRVKHWSEVEIDAEMEADLAQLFGRLWSIELTFDGEGKPSPTALTMTPEAKRTWINFYNAHGQEQVKLTGDLAAAWSKLEGYAARLALVIHLVRWAAGDETASADEIDSKSIEAGVILSRWFGQEAKRVYAVLSEGEEGEEFRRIEELAQRNGGVLTPRDLKRSSRRYGNTENARQALENQVRAGTLRKVDGGYELVGTVSASARQRVSAEEESVWMA